MQTNISVWNLKGFRDTVAYSPNFYTDTELRYSSIIIIIINKNKINISHTLRACCQFRVTLDS